MKSSIIKTIILLIFTNSFLYGQESEFEYNEDIMVRYAILAMEERNIRLSKQSEFSKNFDTVNYLTIGKVLKDCEGNDKKVILVIFDGKKRKSNASVYMIYSRYNTFDTFLRTGSSIQSAKSEFCGFWNMEDGEDLFNCGI